MWDQVSSAAQSHKLALSYFSFIAALEDTRSVLAYAPELCVKLQGAYVDVGYAYREVSNVNIFLVSQGQIVKSRLELLKWLEVLV